MSGLVRKLHVSPVLVGARALSSSSIVYAGNAPSKAHYFVEIPDSSFPKGFQATASHCGVKKKAGVLDLSVILSTSPRNSSAACFTRNVFKAAPVQVSTDVLRLSGGRARALVINSGCANAVTGTQGLQDAWSMVRATDALLPEIEGKKPENETLVLSTGVIGQLLPIQKITNGIADLKASMGTGFKAWELAARAFMTTDTFPKLRARTFKLNGVDVRIAGIDKGAGMIHPNMGPPPGPPHATLLGFIATDAAVSPGSLQSALTYAVDRSFNSISVDGDMSTNDTIIAMANGASGMEKEIDEKADPEAYEVFRDELTSFATELAQLVVRDGEGATKFVTVSVEGAPTYEDAHRIASTISTSALVKCALFGEDANWGRILCAVGYAPVSCVDPTKVSVSFVPSDGSSDLALLVNGEPQAVDEARASQILEKEDLEIRVTLGVGNEGAKYYTCDFSHEYVTINGSYRS
ncbi:hypothetical protein BOTBODRAFT_168156 [Botryobasidium botryosum FD-172 SS1]|uniref:Arginine biosynthesis bifunctional protein ArgJ, mitochondrial n=1 Tax=Botryobasidium botryosum (strain FD-172 SS1) TaxID=930990 RepID=A0A067LVN0_BOTB1|nr:hypothetical protein BOTBODRAFT_168156 [Botryobasidium botryosum FD-172 SS1]